VVTFKQLSTSSCQARYLNDMSSALRIRKVRSVPQRSSAGYLSAVKTEVQACSAMVAGNPISHVTTAFAALSLQYECPAILYSAACAHLVLGKAGFLHIHSRTVKRVHAVHGMHAVCLFVRWSCTCSMWEYLQQLACAQDVMTLISGADCERHVVNCTQVELDGAAMPTCKTSLVSQSVTLRFLL
jgi:hypothetical protein